MLHREEGEYRCIAAQKLSGVSIRTELYYNTSKDVIRIRAMLVILKHPTKILMFIIHIYFL